MDDMTKQDIAARMAKAAIELDRLEKEKKETVREYNEQINDVQDQIISLARQYEDNTPTLFDVTYDFAPAGDVEDAKEVRLLPAGEPEGKQEPEAEEAAEPQLNIYDILDTERIVIEPNIPGGSLRAHFGKYPSFLSTSFKSVCFVWSVDIGLGDFIISKNSGDIIGDDTEGLTAFPRYLNHFKDDVDELLRDRGAELEDSPVNHGLLEIRKTIENWITVITKYLKDQAAAQPDDELPFPEAEEPQELKYIPSEEQLAIPENQTAEYHAPQRKRRVKRGAL